MLKRCTTWQRTFVVLLFALALMLSACGGSQSSTTGAAPSLTPTQALKGSIPSSLPNLMVMAMDYKFQIPATINAGLVVVNFMNDGKEPHELSFLRLNEGVSIDQFKAALIKDPATSFALIKWRGGVATLMPGQSGRAVLNFDPGEYVLSCFVESPNGLPHFVEGMYQPFKVVASTSTSQATEPTADGTAIIKNFNFTLPNLHAGTVILKVTNEDPMAHEMNILKLADGKTMQDATAFLHKKKGPPPLDTKEYGTAPFTYAGGMQPIEHGLTDWIELNLQPGNYVAVCFVPDPKTHMSHVDEGMITQFTIQ